MRILVLLLVSVLGCAYAMPPRYYAAPLNDDDDADVQDEPFDSFDDMFTFPTGGPGGPPSNTYLQGTPNYNRLARTDVEEDGETYYLTIDPDSRYGELDDVAKKPVSTDLARRYKIVKRRPPVVEEQVKHEEEEDEEEEDDAEDTEDQDQDDGEQDDDAKADYSVPDFNELFPNPDDRPRGPGGYGSYMKHHPSNQQSRPEEGNGGSAPPPGRGRAPPPPPPGRGRDPPPPPPRRYRYLPLDSEESGEMYDAIIIDAETGRYRAIDNNLPEEDEEEDDDVDDDVDGDEESDDDVDFSVPSYDTLFPAQPGNSQAGNKPPGGIFSGMRNSWNNAPQPPQSRTADRYGRVIRLFQSPMHHDAYNPDYIINPQIALERRNQRMKYRYRNPGWRIQNPLTPYNYKPLLYQKGHWGNPREHDVNPYSGDYYLGGIYNGKNYY